MTISDALLGAWQGCVKNANERSRKVDVGGGLFLNALNDLTLSSRDDGLEFVVDLADFSVQAGLTTSA